MISGSLPRVLARHWSLLVMAALLAAQGSFVIWTAAKAENHSAWSRLIIFPIWPAYGDLRTITRGWDEAAAGRDALREGNDAPGYNYPRLWLLGAKLGWRSNNTDRLGAAVTVLFLAAVCATGALAPGWTRLLLFGVMASPPLWLALERGNGDLLIFALLTPALFALPARGGRGSWSQPVILLAAMLKLFPAACFAAELRGLNRERGRRLAVMTVVFAGYLAVTFHDIQAALRKTDYGTRESYGVNIAADKLQAAWQARPAPVLRPPSWLADPRARQLALRCATVLLIALAGTLAWRSRRQRHGESSSAGEERAARLFLAGAAVYLATFVLGLNWAYRLLFLIWTLPWLAREIRGGDWRGRAWAGTALGLIMFTCWQLAAKSDYDAPLGHLASIALIYPLARQAAILLLPSPGNPVTVPA